MFALTLLLGPIAAVLLLPSVSEAISLFRWPFLRRQATPPPIDPAPPILFLVPAHNEELMLPACLRALATLDYPSSKRSILVIADNCSDRTAAVARAEGARVLERRDEGRRGKPQAIAWALEQVDPTGFDALVIIDADTQVPSDFARVLAARGPLVGKVLQPFIGVQNPDENALTRMAAVHGTAAHGLAYRVKERVGLNVPLGVGMCIGRDVLLEEEWSAFSIAEDWELYAIFTARGVRIEPVADAHIYAQEARSFEQSAPQRHRWMAGKLEVLVRYLPRLIASPNIGPSQRFDAVAELVGLGPAVHLGLAVVGAAAAWVGASPTAAGRVIAVMFLVSLVRPLVYTVGAILCDPEPGRALKSFLFLPVYTVWRLASALRSVTGAPGRAWVRTARHVESSDDR